MIWAIVDAHLLSTRQVRDNERRQNSFESHSVFDESSWCFACRSKQHCCWIAIHRTVTKSKCPVRS